MLQMSADMMHSRQGGSDIRAFGPPEFPAFGMTLLAKIRCKYFGSDNHYALPPHSIPPSTYIKERFLAHITRFE